MPATGNSEEEAGSEPATQAQLATTQAQMRILQSQLATTQAQVAVAVGEQPTATGDGSDPAAGADVDAVSSPASAEAGSGERLVFVSDRDGQRDLYAINADGSGLARLTSHAAEDTDPACSPDGTRVAFVSDRSGTQDIYLLPIDADDAGITQITSIDEQARSPAWSPAGNQLVFVATSGDATPAGSRSTLSTVNADGTELTQLTQTFTQTTIMQPAWSPAGNHIAFTANIAGNNVILYLHRTSAAISSCIPCATAGRR